MTVSKAAFPLKRLILLVLALAIAITAIATPASAEAAPWLSASEARREIGKTLHRHAKWGAVTGSLRARCYGERRNIVRCAISFEDWDGYFSCGTARVRETYARYYVRLHVDLC